MCAAIFSQSCVYTRVVGKLHSLHKEPRGARKTSEGAILGIAMSEAHRRPNGPTDRSSPSAKSRRRDRSSDLSAIRAEADFAESSGVFAFFENALPL